MGIKDILKKFWDYLKRDSWDSWIVSVILLLLIVKFVFFPLLSLATGSSLPLVIVESCSMYHGVDFDEWWSRNSAWYESKGITKEDFNDFSFSDGLNKGDIILVLKKSEYKKGDIIIYNPSIQTTNPIIHRIISYAEIQTKGDHNPDQIPFEKEVNSNQIFGKAAIKIPLLGWIKLIFFEPFRSSSDRGFCKI